MTTKVEIESEKRKLGFPNIEVRTTSVGLIEQINDEHQAGEAGSYNRPSPLLDSLAATASNRFRETLLRRNTRIPARVAEGM